MKIDLDNSLGFILNRTNTRMKNNLLHKFKDYDITPEQWAILNRLWVRDGISPKEIAELTSKDQPTTVRIIAKLQKKGFVSKKVNPKDNRSFLIYLTPKGEESKDILIPLALEALDKAIRGIDKDQIEVTKVLLNQIFKNLEA
ncbi:MarR family winged helix-turn-helix transcriptional regulator [Desulfoscipio gibsoniae]|uniref:Transcriptional regulator n=1 Tax=Desulfoscipio gibsoniae DSM 7213 TaxID=767817 RepID=R4KAV0_9FIRM|nr:MarR family transcriptional regulator [Desulfoscipio gibsoniae]AGL00313.1 transcriptional regulator [Desulfoscipio gibsoniae DSM 7213]